MCKRNYSNLFIFSHLLGASSTVFTTSNPLLPPPQNRTAQLTVHFRLFTSNWVQRGRQLAVPSFSPCGSVLGPLMKPESLTVPEGEEAVIAAANRATKTAKQKISLLINDGITFPAWTEIQRLLALPDTGGGSTRIWPGPQRRQR